jgi:hypothetical protein
MVKKVEGGYKCAICGMLHDRDTLAVACEKSHEIIYIPINRQDLFKLIQFIYTKDSDLLSESLVQTLQKYSKGSYV